MTTAVTKARTWVPELTFGARLALVRRAKGWNMKEAAAKCGLPAQSWRQWEVGGHLPRRYVDVAKQISGATGVDYLWLVHGPDRGEGGGGGDLTIVKDPLAERPIKRRTAAGTQPNGPSTARRPPAASPVGPTRRRPQEVRSPNRAELVPA